MRNLQRKKPFIVLALLLLMCGLLWLTLPKITPPIAEQVEQTTPPAKPSTRLTVIKLPRVEPLESWQPNGSTPKTIPENMRGATDDPSVVELLTNYQRVEVGKVVATDKGTQQLWVGPKLLFEARRIGSRSRAEDGTIWLDAITGEHPPIEEAEVTGTGDEAKLISSPREIWFVTPIGSKTRLQLPSMDAFAPVIDPSGKTIAFTGRLLDDKGFPSSQRLYVGGAVSGQYRVFAGDEHLQDYQVWAFDWVKDGTVLRVLQDHGETGGHMKLKQVRVE
jgi:hypothetical protein